MRLAAKFYLILALLVSGTSHGQIINAYANVTAITGNSILTLGTVDQTSDVFQAGGEVVIMQMQDSVISSNSNTSTFGDMGSIRNAGVYEIKLIASVSPTTGTPTLVTLSSPLSNTYNFCNNCNVQLITFRSLGAYYPLNSNIIGKVWNGTLGGVIAFTTYSLTMSAWVSADGIGFAGGPRNTADAGGSICEGSVYAVSTTTSGMKGQGIFKRTATYQTCGRGHISNGGGGGMGVQTGGGGGGNYTAGGNAGLGIGCTTLNTGAGLGGVSLASYINVNRIFMGGGGGGACGGNTQKSGANGGGIIVARIGTITTTSCGGAGGTVKFTANGGPSPGSNIGGAGGGGAGGTIVLYVTTFSISATCPLVISANGSNGGSVMNTTITSSGGGGGGQGAVFIMSPASPSANVTVQTLNGAAGSDSNLGNVSGTGASGTNNAGIFGFNTLSIKLESFTGTENQGSIVLNWKTASEENSKEFIIEKLFEGIEFRPIGKTEAAHHSIQSRRYSFIDPTPFYGKNYYRLRQVDADSTDNLYPSIVVNFDGSGMADVFPNPVQRGQNVSLKFAGPKSNNIKVSALCGKSIFTGTPADFNTLSASLPAGVYLVSFEDLVATKPMKLVVQD